MKLPNVTENRHALLASGLFLGALLLTFTIGLGAVADDSPAIQGPKLHLNNGDFAVGQLEDSDSSQRLRWQSPQFARPLEFAVAHLNAIHFPSLPVPPKPTGDYCLELSAGDVLFGSLRGMTADFVELDVAHSGRLHVRRAEVRRLYRWNGGDELIYLGPNGLLRWDAAAAGDKWRDEGGQPYTDKPGAVLSGDFKLPEQVSIELDLSWKNKPDFTFRLAVGDTELSKKQAFRLEVWDQELVLHRETEGEADVAGVQSIKPGAGQVRIQLYLDQLRNRLLAFSFEGVQLADLQVSPNKPQTGTGLSLTNANGDVRLDRLRISRWNGVAPAEVTANKSRMHRVDGSIAYGQLVGYDPRKDEFSFREGDQERRVAARDMASAFLSPPTEDPAEAPAGSLRIVHQDGTRLTGALVKIESATLSLTCPSIVEPVNLPLREARSVFSALRSTPAPSPPLSVANGLLELEGVRLRGRLLEGSEQPGASSLFWRPDLSDNDSPLSLGVAGRITYRQPAVPEPTLPAVPQPPPGDGFLGGLLQVFGVDPPRRDAVPTLGPPTGPPPSTTVRSLHLLSGDSIPCEVSAINAEGIAFQTPLSEATFVPHSKIKAVELLPQPVLSKLNKRKRERLLTLPRMQKDSPPTQLICSKNGDFLRGRVLEMDDQVLQLEVRLETQRVPRDRIAQIIWLHANELASVPDAPGPASGATATRIQAMRSDGIRLTFFVDRCAGDTVSGTSDVLGACRVDLSQVDQLIIGDAIEKAAAELAYHQWKLRNATEPKFVQNDDGSAAETRTPGTESPLVGKPAPDFTLEQLDGKRFHLAECQGEIVVLDFWATWCGPCLQAMPQVERAVHEFRDDGVRLVAVNLEEAPAQIKSMLERHKLQVAVALDRDGVVATKYSATAIPQTVIIDRSGNVARLFVGGGPRLGDQIRAALRDVLANPPSP